MELTNLTRGISHDVVPDAPAPAPAVKPARKPRTPRAVPTMVEPAPAPAPVAPSITLTADQLQAIIDGAVQAVVAKYSAPAPAPAPVETLAPAAPCDACTINMMAGIGLCTLHAAPPACEDCLARCEPCAQHGGARPAPAAPFSYPASAKPAVPPADSKRATLREFRDILSPLSPRVIGDWQAKLGNARNVLQDAGARLALRAYLRAAWEHSEHIRALETTIKGLDRQPTIVPVLPYVRPIADALLNKGTSPSSRQAQYLVRYAQAEYTQLDVLWTQARAGAADTTAQTDSARTPEQYPQNAQYHSSGARQWSDADLADAMRAAHARGGSIAGMHVVAPTRTTSGTRANNGRSTHSQRISLSA